MGKIVRDERYTNTVWCLCNNYEEYLQFAKDLWLYTDIDHGGIWNVYLYGERIKNEERWFTDSYVWSNLFGVDRIDIPDPENDGWIIEYYVDPINDTYEIKEKPEEDEYPVVVQYSLHGELMWISLNKLK